MLSIVATTVAALLLLAVALAPGVITSDSGLALLRVPIEAVIGLLVLALLPWAFARRIVAVLIAAFLVGAVALAALDQGFETTLARPFNVVTDWSELGAAFGVLSDSTGQLVAALIVILLLVVAVGLLLAVAWA
ncbi:MAG: hypothetical protein ACTHON_04460, partial [Humibacter sp.]